MKKTNTPSKLEQVSTDLFNQNNELRFVQAAMSNMEQALKYQRQQKDAHHWEVFSTSTYKSLQTRESQLKDSIDQLSKEQVDLYQSQYATV